MSTVVMTTPYPRTNEFLTDLGIDPSTVAADGITINGYDSFDLNESGERVIQDGGWGARGLGARPQGVAEPDDRRHRAHPDGNR